MQRQNLDRKGNESIDFNYSLSNLSSMRYPSLFIFNLCWLELPKMVLKWKCLWDQKTISLFEMNRVRNCTDGEMENNNNHGDGDKH